MNKYVDLFVSAIAAGLVAGCAVYQTTPNLTPSVVAGVAAFATAVIQQRRQWPREEWTDEQRKEKA